MTVPMKVVTVLPTLMTEPSGGFRVHYEYANRLAARGHDVSVVHRIESFGQRLHARRRGVRRLVWWFEFDPRVSLLVAPRFSIPLTDVAILTAWMTAEARPALRARARVFAQVVYDYEYWMTADAATRARMARAFRMADLSIATSSAVASMLRDVGRAPDVMISCAIDQDAFHPETDPADRPPVIGLIARWESFKRIDDAIRALEILRETREVRVLAAGRERRPLPDWIERWDAPNDEAMRAFYNRVAVFVLPSEYEGWGLPAAEAMACGAAVVTTRSGGVEDFAVHGENALLVPPRDPDALAGALASLLDDHDLRVRIAHRGLATARRMSWDRPVDELETVLRSALESQPGRAVEITGRRLRDGGVSGSCGVRSTMRVVRRRMSSPLASDLGVGLVVGRSDPRLAVDAVRVRRISRQAFGGWVAANPNRGWEYPWVLRHVRKLGAGVTKRAVDFGAGKSPVPIGLVRLGYDTDVVDPDSEPVLGRRYGNEWDFVDYAPWGITTHRAGMEEQLFDADELGVAVSVSVIEHLPAELRRLAIREVARVVEPDGLIILTVDVQPGGSQQLWNRVVDEIEPLGVHGTVDDVVDEAAACGLSLRLIERCPIPESESAVVGMILRKDAYLGS